jgi:hypothetical protein
MLESNSARKIQVEDLSLIGMMWKGNKKGLRKGNKEESRQAKKNLSNGKFFRCHQKRHYANEFL